MAEKRVSVRLAAVGGKQVRAELEGVGDAGEGCIVRCGCVSNVVEILWQRSPSMLLWA